MILKQCMLTANDCYKKGQKMDGGKPTGIVVHSTGANNKTLKRYVQPLKSDPDYAEIIADIGTNIYNNHWNMSAAAMGRSACVHAFIGVNAAEKVETYQTLPFNICGWGVGSGSKGSYNYNPQARIQFEICEDALTDRAYFDAAFREAIELCAYLCKTYGFGVDKISSHYESYLAGYGGNHGDCDHWLKKFGLTMDWFRSEVDKLLRAESETNTTTTTEAKKVDVSVTVIKKGVKGEAVKAMQTLLNLRNNAGLDVDGSCGTKSDAAIRAFQQSRGLTVDGSCGKATWTALLGE